MVRMCWCGKRENGVKKVSKKGSRRGVKREVKKGRFKKGSHERCVNKEGPRRGSKRRSQDLGSGRGSRREEGGVRKVGAKKGAGGWGLRSGGAGGGGRGGRV